MQYVSHGKQHCVPSTSPLLFLPYFILRAKCVPVMYSQEAKLRFRAECEQSNRSIMLRNPFPRLQFRHPISEFCIFTMLQSIQIDFHQGIVFTDPKYTFGVLGIIPRIESKMCMNSRLSSRHRGQEKNIQSVFNIEAIINNTHQ